MTISQSTKDDFQTEISSFHAQHHDDQCYPAGVKNILDRFADRKNLPEMSMSLSDVNDICGYKRGMRCEEDLIQERLTSATTEYGFEAVEKQAPDMDYEELDSVINDEDTSLPLVELDPQYFSELPEIVESYDAQPSSEQTTAHVVLPYKINTDEVLYYDPYEKFHEKKPGVEDSPYRLPWTDFYELWSGDYEERWTLWLGRRGYELTDIIRDSKQ